MLFHLSSLLLGLSLPISGVLGLGINCRGSSSCFLIDWDIHVSDFIVVLIGSPASGGERGYSRCRSESYLPERRAYRVFHSWDRSSGSVLVPTVCCIIAGTHLKIRSRSKACMAHPLVERYDADSRVVARGTQKGLQGSQILPLVQAIEKHRCQNCDSVPVIYTS